jgi:hypothetical protein
MSSFKDVCMYVCVVVFLFTYRPYELEKYELNINYTNC